MDQSGFEPVTSSVELMRGSTQIIATNSEITKNPPNKLKGRKLHFGVKNDVTQSVSTDFPISTQVSMHL